MFQIRYAVCFTVIGFAVLLSGCTPTNPVVVQVDKDGAASSISQPGVPSLIGTYPMDVVCDTNAELRIKKIAITDSKTIIHLVFKSARTTQIRTGAPGQQVAFYIADPNSRAEYRLLNIEGISLEPSWTPLEIGESLAFKLTFERIPDTLTTFHLIEGKMPSLTGDGLPTVSWTFMNVTLK